MICFAISHRNEMIKTVPSLDVQYCFEINNHIWSCLTCAYRTYRCVCLHWIWLDILQVINFTLKYIAPVPSECQQATLIRLCFLTVRLAHINSYYTMVRSQDHWNVLPWNFSWRSLQVIVCVLFLSHNDHIHRYDQICSSHLNHNPLIHSVSNDTL